MNIKVRWISGKYAEVTIESGNTVIIEGPLDNKEIEDLIKELRNAIDDLTRD